MSPVSQGDVFHQQQSYRVVEVSLSQYFTEGSSKEGIILTKLCIESCSDDTIEVLCRDCLSLNGQLISSICTFDMLPCSLCACHRWRLWGGLWSVTGRGDNSGRPIIRLWISHQLVITCRKGRVEAREVQDEWHSASEQPRQAYHQVVKKSLFEEWQTCRKGRVEARAVRAETQHQGQSQHSSAGQPGMSGWEWHKLGDHKPVGLTDWSTNQHKGQSVRLGLQKIRILSEMLNDW